MPPCQIPVQYANQHCSHAAPPTPPPHQMTASHPPLRRTHTPQNDTSRPKPQPAAPHTDSRTARAPPETSPRHCRHSQHHNRTGACHPSPAQNPLSSQILTNGQSSQTKYTNCVPRALRNVFATLTNTLVSVPLLRYHNYVFI